jgi:hypothetical protein
MEFPLSIIRYANFINIYNQKTKLAIRIDRLIKELGFYGSEKSGEKNLLVSLGQLLEEAKIWIEQVHTIASEDEVEAVLAKLQDCLNDIDWEIAEEIEQILGSPRYVRIEEKVFCRILNVTPDLPEL